MTVTYSLDVASSSFFCLYKLLFRWKGSIWKSVWAELLLWLILYATLSITYRFFLPKNQREVFEDICVFFDTYSSFIPITFMLGFYVSAVFTRWWQIFDNIGWIDTPALWISQYIRGKDERARKLRRTCIRYLVLTQAMVFRDVSAGVRKRFPTMNHLVTAGLMTEKEMSEFDSIVSPHAKYWQPMHWVFSLVRIAREEGKIIGEVIYVDLMEKLRQFRVQILSLTLYDWVPVPLVYTQVVHLAVRSYFAIALLGRQYLTIERDVPNRNTIDLYVPIMSILQFIFFIGWMKVAEVLLNPLGEDDDDFECNYILDRNLQVGFSVVDDAFDKFPPVDKDSFWEDTIPEPLYTAQSAQRPMNPQVGSCVDMNTDEEPFMVRPRRRTISRMSHWDRDVDENDVVPVYGMQKLKDNSNYASGESLAFSQSFLNQSRKLSEMFKRMRGGRKNSEGISSMGSFYRHRRSRKQSRSEVNMESNQKQMSCNSSSSSIEQFGESFHNSVSPPPSVTKIPGTFHCNSAPDTLKSQKDEEGVKPPTSPTAGVSWFVDEMLPVIEEEENEKKRVSDEDSLRSSSVRSMGRTVSASNDPLPALHEKQGMEILSEHIDEQDTNTPREERQGDITNQTIL